MDVIVIGGGQAALAAAYFLRRAGLSYTVLDDQDAPGGAWRHTWPSLRLFSPAEYSSLPGWRMPPSKDGNPDAAHVMAYLTEYERRYEIPVERPVRVEAVRRTSTGFEVDTDRGTRQAAAVISATGTWSRPFVPAFPGRESFGGRQWHSAVYDGPDEHAGRRVMVVGGANSGAQIAADLAPVCELVWCTLAPPRYLPDDVDGRELFRLASARVRGEDGAQGVGGLGDIVVVPPVREARDTGLLDPEDVPQHFTRTGAVWADGTSRELDHVIWCTGFRPALRHLADLEIPRHQGRFATDGPRVVDSPGLYVLGYGDWCGAASATLIGVGQWARAAVRDIVERLDA
ncbi:ArsO family NAD(P)H-dependent flavin-containing monooxygenase [Mobilicoccus caccae]|uniref:Monooxygenase n=1 Tax=Mobilicoccus caccae TaxID=1859295 RepID=A0ABQ6IXN1_9MICO|nr:ArsO family NAD(P)H-dependent flavin-containing monooxygenase [Mobilicoccus caccae]GMA42073.1 monooxygenase [Mobilicoccus caccae]